MLSNQTHQVAKSSVPEELKSSADPTLIQSAKPGFSLLELKSQHPIQSNWQFWYYQRPELSKQDRRAEASQNKLTYR